MKTTAEVHQGDDGDGGDLNPFSTGCFCGGHSPISAASASRVSVLALNMDQISVRQRFNK